MKKRFQNRLIGGLVFLVLLLPSFSPVIASSLSSSLRATEGSEAISPSPWIFDLRVDLRPVIHSITAPYRFLAFFNESIQAQSPDISQKSLAVFTSPYHGAVLLKKGLDAKSDEVVSRIEQITSAPYKTANLLNQEIDFQRKSVISRIEQITTSPYRFAKVVKEKVESAPSQLAALFQARKAKKGQEIIIVQYPQRPGVIARTPSEAKRTKQSQPQRIIVKEKEIIREVVVKETIRENPLPPAGGDSREFASLGDKLTALRTELTDSFVKRINTLVGGFGFTSNRFDNIYVQKDLELQGKLTQPSSVSSSPITFASSLIAKAIDATSLILSDTLTVSSAATSTIAGHLKIGGGLSAGTGNVAIIDSTGKIPALSSAYFAQVPNIFSSIANASSTLQFSASGVSDTLSFEGSGGVTISFDSTAKKITFSSTVPTLLNVLSQASDASTFTGTTKIAGLTIDSSGFLILPYGTSTTPSLTFNSDTDTGIFAKASDILGFTTGGVERMRITGAGNVELAGNLQLSGFALLPHGTSTAPSLAFASDTDTGIFAKESNILAFSTGGIERLRLNASGNAIFTGFALLPSGTSTTPSLGFTDDTDTGIFSKGSDILAFGTGGLERLRIDGSGNVSIGKTSADQKLDVSGTLQVTGFKLATGATVNYLLTSDASGVGTWQAPPATAWSSCASSPAFASATTFTVTNNQTSTDTYYIGRIVRYKDTAGGSTYQYTAVSAYSAGTVTVVDGGLDSGFTSCQSGNFAPLKFIFAIPGRLPSVATNNISSRIIVGETFEPVRVNWYVETTASTNGATAGNTTIRLRSGTSPTADGTTDVMAANTLAYNASEKLNVNPTHTTISDGTYLQVDVTGAPTAGQADDLTLILYGVPQWAKNL